MESRPRQVCVTLWLILLCISAGAVSGDISVICEDVCFLAELNCFCEVSGVGLTWSLLNLAMDVFGNVAIFTTANDVNEEQVVGMGNFTAVLTNNTPFTSVITGRVDLGFDGYKLLCSDFGVTPFEIPISIPDKPSQPEDLMLITNISTESIILSWTPPINNSQCVIGYTINSTLANSTVSIPNTLNYTLNAMGKIIPSCTYIIRVAANDTGGRIGDWSESLFSFEESSPIMSDPPPQITNLSLSYQSNQAVKIVWSLPSNLSMECIDIIFSTNASAPSSTNGTSALITKPVEDPADTTYTVSVAAVDKAGRRGEWSDTLCFSFQISMIQEVHLSDICSNTITIQWKVELTNCEALVSSYFITTINTKTNTYNLTSTNETTHTLSDVQVGEVYVIQIVPSGVLGNGSATVTTINIPNYCITTSNMFLPSMTLPTSDAPTPPGLCENSSAVIGVIVAIAVALILLTVIGSVMTYCIYKKKETTIHVNIDSKIADVPSDRVNSETESTENMMLSSTIPQAYMSPSDAKKDYNQHKLKEEPKSEYASPHDAHHDVQKQTQEIPMYQEIDHLKKREHHGDREHSSAHEKRDTVTLDRDKIMDMEGYSDLPAHSKKSANGKKSPSKNKSSTIKTFPGNSNYADLALSPGPHPPPSSQSSVDYASVYTPSEYATVQKNKKTHS